MHSCTTTEQRKKTAGKKSQKHCFFSKVEGPDPLRGGEVWDKREGKRGDSKKETYIRDIRGEKIGGGPNKDIPQRGSYGSTSTEAQPMGYTQVLGSTAKMTLP